MKLPQPIERILSFLAIYKFETLLVGAVALFALSPLFVGDSDDPASTPERPAASAPAPKGSSSIASASEFAERVFYAGGGTREWGTVCRYRDGFVSVDHVTRNGTPVVGPKLEVTASSEISDWSILGIDPRDVNLAEVPELKPGLDVQIAGFPARDLEGEVLPGRVYIDDNTPPFWWVELLPLPDGGPPEGAVGGQSGSCVLAGGEVAGVVSANGFSKIDGTTNTWALVVPLAEILREARGEPRQKPTSFIPDTRRRPEIALGRSAIRPEQ